MDWLNGVGSIVPQLSRRWLIEFKVILFDLLLEQKIY